MCIALIFTARDIETHIPTRTWSRELDHINIRLEIFSPGVWTNNISRT